METKKRMYFLEKLPVMNTLDRLKYGLLMVMGVAATLVFALWWFNPSHIAQNFIGLPHGLDILLFILLSYVVWYQIINEIFLWYTQIQ